jgi:hypothetical protein
MMRSGSARLLGRIGPAALRPRGWLGLALAVAAAGLGSPAAGWAATSTYLALPATAEEALASSRLQALGPGAVESDGWSGLAAASAAGDALAPMAGASDEGPLLAQGAPPDTAAVPAANAAGKAGGEIPPYVARGKNPGLAIGEAIGTNVAVWTYDRFIRSGGGQGFKVGIQSWKQNILNGFNWDDNSFSTNQFGHPYQGSYYFNAGRSNGYGYLESFGFSWLGSFTWEYFGEANYPALNDWINTSMGGAAFGEALFRLSRMVTDNTTTGSGRFWREMGGLVISPIRGFTRIVTGDWSKVQENPPDRLPKVHHMIWRFGARTEGENNLWTADTTHAFIELAAGYGDPFLGEDRKPFDSFNFGLQLNFKDKSQIGRVNAKGLLFATPFSKSENTTTMIGGFQYYDYVNNSAFEYGAQRLGASFMSLRKPAANFEARTHIDLIAIVLGATNSAYASVSGRDYDFGPGVAAQIGGEFRYKGHPFLHIAQEVDYIHTLNGTVSSHLLSETTVMVDVPLWDTFTANATYFLYQAQGYYRDFPDVYQRTPILRLSLSWHRR